MLLHSMVAIDNASALYISKFRRKEPRVVGRPVILVPRRPRQEEFQVTQSSVPARNS